jgi:alpha-1,6-mannosyltransferase
MGRLGPIDDSAVMAANILHIWNGDHRAMSDAATRHAHSFSWDRSMEALFGRIYRDALAARAEWAIGNVPAEAALARAA